jgi:putative beta-lysine N-acetyltransferase
MDLHRDDLDTIVDKLYDLAILKRYTKIFAKVPEWAIDTFLARDYKVEASIPKLYNGTVDGYFLGLFFSADRSYVSKKEMNLIESIREMSTKIFDATEFSMPQQYSIRLLEQEHVPQLAGLYKMVFSVYPFPIMKKKYLKKSMEGHVSYYGIFEGETLAAASSCEIDEEHSNAEMTDFATDPLYRGQNLSYFLLQYMGDEMQKSGLRTLYTIARATSHGMNKTFGRQGYQAAGTLVNNTLIGKSIESMNVWYKNL